MEEEKKKRRIFDKILMGAIIGGAIGSVVGASIAPKEGKDTRKDIIDAAKLAKEKTVPILRKVGIFIKKCFKKEDEELKKIPREMNK